MNRRHVVSILCCAALVYACAPHSRATANTVGRKEASPRPPASASTALALTVAESNSARAMTFAIELKNTGKLTEVRFVNGRTHEFVVVDRWGREVWRWSTGRLFTQSLQTKQLRTGDVIRYEAKWDTGAPGTYRVIASLNSAMHADPIEQEFVVR
jgi:hypothetical protein